MRRFETKTLPTSADAVAPDGSSVRLLPAGRSGSMAHFELGPFQVSKAVTHRTVEEIWYFLSGRGQMWRQQDQLNEVVDVRPGVAITIPAGTHFQFRSNTAEPLRAIGITMPPWPGEDEAMLIPGHWLNTMP